MNAVPVEGDRERLAALHKALIDGAPWLDGGDPDYAAWDAVLVPLLAARLGSGLREALTEASREFGYLEGIYGHQGMEQGHWGNVRRAFDRAAALSGESGEPKEPNRG